MSETKKLALTGVFTALITVLTTFPQIPNGMGGYIHAGDAVIFAACVFLGWRAVPAAAAGSALADVVSGYAFYAPATFIIKGLMSAAAVLVLTRFTFVKKQRGAANADTQICANDGIAVESADTQICASKAGDGEFNADTQICANDNIIGENNDGITGESAGAVKTGGKASVWRTDLRQAAAFILASLIMQAGYIAVDVFALKIILNPVSVAIGLIQSAVGIPLGLLLSRILRPVFGKLK